MAALERGRPYRRPPFQFTEDAVERATDALLRQDYRHPADVGEVLREEFRGTVRAVLAEVVGEVRDEIERVRTS